MIHILSQINPYMYNNLIGKDIKIEFLSEKNNKQNIKGKCLTIPPPLIICDLYNDIAPCVRVQSMCEYHTVYHIPINKITNIYLTREDNISKIYAVLICQRKKICKDLERYIITFINGWTRDVVIR